MQYSLMLYLNFLFIGSCTREGLNTVSNDELRNHFYIVICYEREFGELCKDYFGHNEARAACRQLGYVEGSKKMHQSLFLFALLFYSSLTLLHEHILYCY